MDLYKALLIAKNPGEICGSLGLRSRKDRKKRKEERRKAREAGKGSFSLILHLIFHCITPP